LQPSQVHSATVGRSIPVVITPDLVSSSEAVPCFVPPSCVEEVVPMEKFSRDTSWEERLQELASYNQANGLTNVPQCYPPNKPLGLWVNNQRCRKSKISKERIQSLEKLGFDWSPGKGSTISTSWDERLLQLKRVIPTFYGHIIKRTTCIHHSS
jgi:hypothetical protein